MLLLWPTKLSRSAMPLKLQAAQNAPAGMCDANSQKRRIGGCPQLSRECLSKKSNNRLTLIRQFQDLERQLQQARQQAAYYRSILPKGALPVDISLASSPYPGAELQPVGSPPSRRQKPAVLRDLSEVRANLTNYGRGLLQIPSTYPVLVPQSNTPQDLPDLPPRHIADHLLSSYHENFHLQFPILHWSTFVKECDQLYLTKSLASLGNTWGAVFMCVLACGTLHTLDPGRTQDGEAFLATAITMKNNFQNDFSIEDARVAFLTGVFFTELNLKSAGWVSLGSAIRISQDIGLHVESGPWSSIEGEMRRRLWYSIYAWDRFAALPFNLPTTRLTGLGYWLSSSANPCLLKTKIMTPNIQSLQIVIRAQLTELIQMDSPRRF